MGVGRDGRVASVDKCASTSRPPPLPLPTRGRGTCTANALHCAIRFRIMPTRRTPWRKARCAATRKRRSRSRTRTRTRAPPPPRRSPACTARPTQSLRQEIAGATRSKHPPLQGEGRRAKRVGVGLCAKALISRTPYRETSASAVAAAGRDSNDTNYPKETYSRIRCTSTTMQPRGLDFAFKWFINNAGKNSWTWRLSSVWRGHRL